MSAFISFPGRIKKYSIGILLERMRKGKGTICFTGSLGALSCYALRSFCTVAAGLLAERTPNLKHSSPGTVLRNDRKSDAAR